MDGFAINTTPVPATSSQENCTLQALKNQSLITAWEKLSLIPDISKDVIADKVTQIDYAKQSFDYRSCDPVF
jgi:hypothetical protein